MPAIFYSSTLLDDPPPPMLVSDSASSASSSPPSPPPRRQRLHRKRSPSPPRHMAKSDIARLLDPAYASPNPLPFKAANTITQVYVDHHGDLHDPDYCHFPAFGHTHMHAHRARRDCHDDSDDEDDEVEHKRISLSQQRPRPSSSTAYYPVPAYTYYPYEEPSSYESHFLAEDDEEPDIHERAPLKQRCLRSRSKSPEKHLPQNDKVEQSSSEDDQQLSPSDTEWTPTCAQSLRHQWHAIALSFRFSLFRTKRRIQRRMSR